jgi:hypothetical protein
MPSDANIEIRTNRQGQIPGDDDLFWPQAMRRVKLGMLADALWAATVVVVLDLIGWALVAGALLFAAVGEAAWFVLPLVFWTASILWALRVFTVRRYRYFANSPDSTQQAVARIARKKTQHLYWAIALWAAGAAALLLALVFELT